MKFLLSAQNIFSAPTLLAQGQIARDLESFGTILEMAGAESLGGFFAILTLLLKTQNGASQKPSKKGLPGMLNLALRITIVCTGDNILQYMTGLVGGAL